MNQQTKTIDEEMLWGEPAQKKATTEVDVCSKNPECIAWWGGKCHAPGGEMVGCNE